VGAWRTAAVLGCMGVFLLWVSFIGTCADAVFALLPCHCRPAAPPAVYRHNAAARTTGNHCATGDLSMEVSDRTTWQPLCRRIQYGG
jgi:hypothetical protein